MAATSCTTRAAPSSISSSRAGHYPEGRSENKGVEPEAAETGRFFGRDLLIAAAERGNALGVYDVSDPSAPAYVQTLPAGIGPEGVKAIAHRRLLVVANEVSVDGVPSMITIYRTSPTTEPEYPQLTSLDDGNGTPIPWVAMSGLTADPEDADTLYAVSDSFLAFGFIYTIDVARAPARITDRIQVTNADGSDLFPDLEGIAVAPEGGFWLASEGRSGARPNALLRTDASGVVQQAVELPPALAARATNNGFEGVAVTEDDGTSEYVYAVVQREWADDPADIVKIARYDATADTWAFVRYEKAPPPPGAGAWVGLSEITALPDGTFAIIERDNRLGTAAQIKRVCRVDLASADFRPYGDTLATVDKTLLDDVLDVLAANSVWTPDKLEGLAVAADGDACIVTDNDGLDDAIGQTVFVELGE